MNTRNSESPTSDSGPAYKAVVRICGLIAIIGIFLPFIGWKSIIEVSEAIQVAIPQMGLKTTISKLFEANTLMGSITKGLMVFAFIIFPLIGLGMLIRGKYAGGPLTFLILFNLALFLLVNFFGADAAITGNFFANTGYGYYISSGALFLPFIAMFFLDKSI
jgi:hypothetical protein